MNRVARDNDGTDLEKMAQRCFRKSLKDAVEFQTPIILVQG